MLLLTAILGAVLAGLATYYFTQQLNEESSIQQQYVSSVQDFAATGAKVDAAITDLGDTVIDGDELAAAKKEARQALSAHAASALALLPLIGKGNVENYMTGIADLRLLVDETGDVPAAVRASRGRNALINNRNAVIAAARRQIYS
ncbi:hypothetical protein [Sphingobium yanoikuyae]|uniref:hypothetical protein n=1 Tax=Sphingobium yanoikuyae TaxID=13690 RepID=UPI0028ADDE0E|nr:hypothetical protein [Sphingobium yanoikuyae]